MAKCHSFQDKIPGYTLLARSESHHTSSTFMREMFVIFYVAINSCVMTQFIWIVKVHGLIRSLPRDLVPIRQGNFKILQGCQLFKMVEAASKMLKVISDRWVAAKIRLTF
jgi:hypothetical protein